MSFQNPVDGEVRPLNDRGRYFARRTSRAGVKVKQATTVSASPIATLGPVLEKSLNRVVPMRANPVMTVPALVRIGSIDRLSVARIAPAGLAEFQCSPKRHDMNRQKSVPHPKRITTRNSSTSGDISQP